MKESDGAHQVMLAALSLHEMFGKFVLASIPGEIRTKTQMDAVLTLQAAGPQSMTALARRLNVAPEQVTRAVRALREADIVACERRSDNRRVVEARLTEKGERLIDAHAKDAHARITGYLDAIGPQDAKRLMNAARAVAEVLFAHDMDAPERPVADKPPEGLIGEALGV